MTYLKHATLANVLEIQHLYPPLCTGHNNCTLEPRMKLDKGGRGGKGNGRQWSQESHIVQFEIGIWQRESLPADQHISTVSLLLT